MTTDTTRTIGKAAALFFSGTFLSRLTGLGRDIIMAFAFGTHPSVAAFLTAYRLAHLLRRLFGEGAMQMAFIPQFEQIRAENPLRAKRFFQDLKAFLMLLLIGVIFILGTIFGFTYLNSGSEMLKLSFLMLPSLFFICLFGMNTSLLQCDNQYFLPSVAPAFFNCVWIIASLILFRIPAEQAMPWLALGIIFASFLQWVVTEPKTHRFLHRISPTYQPFRFTQTEIRKLSLPLFFGFIGVASSQINQAIDSLFAFFAESEGPAYLWYAIRIQQLPLALFGIALSSALLPPLTRAIKANDIPKYRQFLNFAVSRSLTFMVPVTTAIFLMGDLAVNVIYFRGDFSLTSSIETTKCLWAYGIGLIPMTLVIIFAPALYAMNRYQVTTKGSLLALILNTCLNSLMIMKFELGAVSVALATSISAWIHCFYLAYTLEFTPRFFKSLMSTILGIASYFIFIENPTGLTILLGQTPQYPVYFIEKCFKLIQGGAAFGLPVIGFMMYELRSRKFQRY